MPKPELEFFDTDEIPWKKAKEFDKAWVKILSEDPDTGSHTRLLKLEPGFQNKKSAVHDFWEEVYMIKGSFTDLRLDKKFSEGMYACRPPGMEHGPWKSENGCLLFEIRMYKW